MKNRYLLLVVLFVATITTNAQNATKYSNEFLSLGVGARALGMGNAQTANSTDVYSGYWNPAGLAQIKDNVQAAFMHNSYFGGIANYDYLAFAFKPSENNALGISVIRFGVDGILNTLDLIRNGEINYDRISQFSAVDYAFLFSYAQKVDNKNFKYISGMKNADMSWGINAKLINRTAGTFANAWGFGFDAAFKITEIASNWNVGVMVKDATSTFNAWNYSFTEQQIDALAQSQNMIPTNTLEITLPRMILGTAYKKQINDFDITAVIDLETTTDGKRNTLIKSNVISIDPKIGFETGYRLKNDQNKVFLRLGLFNAQSELRADGTSKITTVSPTAGIGLRIQNFSLDYALTDIGDNSAARYSNVFSIKIGINRSDKSPK